MEAQQLTFLNSPDVRKQVAERVRHILSDRRQPSARELVNELKRIVGFVARWEVESVLTSLAYDSDLSHAERDYLSSLLETDDLAAALRGESAPDEGRISAIDTLLETSGRYRNSAEFHDLVDFIGRFKNYAPYNNLLVRIQNPSCTFYATEKDWDERFGRSIKEDARPLLILAPKHPVLLVYDVDQTFGPDLPDHLLRFAQFDGHWDPHWLERLIKNAERHRIRVDCQPLSSLHAGFATFASAQTDEKMRIAIHSELSEPSQFGVLCHEVAHILLGHLGSDEDRWWPSRRHLERAVIEIEAEATAFVVTRHLGLEGASAAYVSRYLNKDAKVPKGVSFDMIATVAGQIERMALKLQPKPLTKAQREQRKSQRIRS